MTDYIRHNIVESASLYGPGRVEAISDEEEFSSGQQHEEEQKKTDELDKKVKKLILDKAFVMLLNRVAEEVGKSNHHLDSVSVKDAIDAINEEKDAMLAALSILGIKFGEKKSVNKTHFGFDTKLDRIKTNAFLNIIFKTPHFEKFKDELKKNKLKYGKAYCVPHVKSDFVAHSRGIIPN
jgi:hypothetical protein